ncbi:MAG: hypothetical protein JXQ75_11960 [Phycisphaerae bacterium]|nr:hypothetical protein [Phycisphaerae bacterium]
MKRRILRKLRTAVVGFGLVGACFCTTVPMEGCDRYFQAVLEEAAGVLGDYDSYAPDWEGDWNNEG